MSAPDPRAASSPWPGEISTSARDLQKLWWSLGRHPWASLVLVPAHSGGSVAELAASLARVGSRLTQTEVGVVAATRLDEDAVLALARLQRRLRREPSGPDASEWPPVVDVTPETGPRRGRVPLLAQGGLEELIPIGPASQVVIAIPPVTDDPRGVAVARQADAVVLSVQFGRTLVAEVKRTIDLVGRDRIAGCFEVVPP